MEQQVQVRRVEGTLPGFVDDRFAGERRELRNELPTGLPANENPSARSRIADARADPLTAPALVGRQVGEIGAMSLTRVHDVVAPRTGGLEHVLNRPDRGPGERQVVPHLVDVSALAAKVGLHVDDQHDRVQQPDEGRRHGQRITDPRRRSAPLGSAKAGTESSTPRSRYAKNCPILGAFRRERRSAARGAPPDLTMLCEFPAIDGTSCREILRRPVWRSDVPTKRRNARAGRDLLFAALCIQGVRRVLSPPRPRSRRWRR